MPRPMKHSRPLTPPTSNLDPTSDLDLRIEQALATPPRITIPEDFARRTALRLAQEPRPHLASAVATPRVGRLAALATLLLLLPAIVLLAPHANGHAIFTTAMEWLLCAQFAALATWIAVAPGAQA